MDYENMTMDELRAKAKEHNIVAGNTGKDKLIAKILEAEKTAKEHSVAILDDKDTVPEPAKAEIEKSTPKVDGKPTSAVSSILASIEEMKENSDDSYATVVDLPATTIIPVTSFTYGGLVYKSPQNNAEFRWNDFGSVCNMSIAQITEMNNYSADFLTKPYVVLGDDRAVQMFRLSKIYENIAQIMNLKDLFSKDIVSIEKTLDVALSVNLRDMLISKIRIMCKNNVLSDIRVIRLLSDKLKFDFEDDIVKR